MDKQLRLAGCAEWFAPEWQPQPGMLARLKSYLRGFAAHGRQVYARRKHIARKLGMALRTVSRYLAWLTSEGWLKTVKRTPRTVIRQVSLQQQLGFSSGTSLGTSSEVKPEAKSKPTSEKHTPVSNVVEASATEPEGEEAPHSSRAAAGNGSGSLASQAAEGEKPPLGAPGIPSPRRDPECLRPDGCVRRYGCPPNDRQCADDADDSLSLHQQRRTGPPMIPLGYCEQFRAYIGIFIAAGLPLCTMDLHRAHAAWVGTPPDQWESATQDALRMCQTRQTRFIQYPVNHLQMQPWTRVAMERVLPEPEPEKPKSRWRAMWDSL